MCALATVCEHKFRQFHQGLVCIPFLSLPGTEIGLAGHAIGIDMAYIIHLNKPGTG